MKNLRYYLDTNAVQSLGTRLESLPNECVYTSVWTQLELVGAIKDDDSFRRKTAALRHLSDSGIFIDQIIPGAKKEQAFGCIAPEGGKIPHLYEVIMPMIFAAGNYEEFWKHIKCQGMEKCVKLIKETDKVTHSFGEQIKSRMDLRIDDFEEKWTKGDKNELLQDAIDYYANLLEKKYHIPKSLLIRAYDHSVDYYMLIHYYYVEQKRYSRNQPAKNDFNDLMHLQYLRNGCILVTDDGGFKDYVNKVVDGLAIGTNQFMKEIGV